jgi:hypothetical protein
VEKQYQDPTGGVIRKDEHILWFGSSSIFPKLLWDLLLLIPIFALFIVYSFIEYGNYGWIVVIIFLVIIVALIMARMKFRDKYAITTLKIILHKKIKD